MPEDFFSLSRLRERVGVRATGLAKSRGAWPKALTRREGAAAPRQVRGKLSPAKGGRGEVRYALASLLLAGHLAGAPPSIPPGNPSAACLRAAAAAERRWGLPAHLLVAIGTVESGRVDPQTGQRLPWPWSANANGTAYVLQAAGEASRVVGWLQGHGIASIDIGCFQVNLHYHPNAFATLAQGFDPEINANYAGYFLHTLFERTGSWDRAIADYHSADPALGNAYHTQVVRAWRSINDQIAAGISEPTRDPHIIKTSASAAAIPVYTPVTLPPSLRAILGLAVVSVELQR